MIQTQTYTTLHHGYSVMSVRRCVTEAAGANLFTFLIQVVVGAQYAHSIKASGRMRVPAAVVTIQLRVMRPVCVHMPNKKTTEHPSVKCLLPLAFVSCTL